MLFSGALLAFARPCSAQDSPPPEVVKPSAPASEQLKLKAGVQPMCPFPEEANEKQVEGIVELKLEVEADGSVGKATAVSGPVELYDAAVCSAKLAKFEPPVHPPVETPYEVWYGHPKPCPGAISSAGMTVVTGGYTSVSGNKVLPDGQNEMPQYPTEDRKAGVEGEMVLLLTIDQEGRVKKVRVLKSLSPHIDKNAMQVVRKWKVTIPADHPAKFPDDFTVHVMFTPLCSGDPFAQSK
jgi:TonB family protein